MAKKAQEADLLGADDGSTLYEEDALASAIGVYRGRLQKGRARLDGSLWRYDHGRVAYTKAGALAILREVGVELPRKKSEGVKALAEALEESALGAPPQPADGCQRLVVMRQAMNTGIVLAGMLSDKEMPYGFCCRVIVGNNANFVKGMELRAAPVDRAQYLYRLVGPLPRTFGRW